VIAVIGINQDTALRVSRIRIGQALIPPGLFELIGSTFAPAVKKNKIKSLLILLLIMAFMAIRDWWLRLFTRHNRTRARDVWRSCLG